MWLKVRSVPSDLLSSRCNDEAISFGNRSGMFGLGNGRGHLG
jgi:hypothetical protein